MGRSQVAYNRTKLRIRGGRGGGGSVSSGRGGGSVSSGRGETGDRSVQNHHNRHETTPSNSNDHYDNDTSAPSSGSVASSSWRRPKRYPRDSVNGDNYAEEDNSSKQSESYNEADAANFKNAEADLLLDMQSAQAYAYATPSSAEVSTFMHNSGRDKGVGSLNLLSSDRDGDTASAILDVSAMAAALNQLPLSQRFMIPRHLAATLVISDEDGDDDEDDAECEEKQENERFHEYEDESVPSAKGDTVVPVPPVDSAAVRAVAATPSSVQTKPPISSSSASESISMQAGAPKSSEQRENNRSRKEVPPPPKVVDVVDVSTSTAAADQRRRNLIQRASVTSPIDLMGEEHDDHEDDNQGEYDDDDVITRLRQGSPREGDAPRAFCPSVSDTANATAPTIAANVTISTAAAIIDCTGEEDEDQWLDKALAGSETFETEHAEGEGQMDDWLDDMIQ